MQWDSSKNAGFTDGEPWLPLADNFRRINVATQKEDEASMLTFYRRLIQLRQREPALNIGDYTPVVTSGPLMAYLRKSEDKSFMVVLNLSHKPCILRQQGQGHKGKIILATAPEREGQTVEGNISLYGDEGLLIASD